jgi:hypothetical protein
VTEPYDPAVSEADPRAQGRSRSEIRALERACLDELESILAPGTHMAKTMGGHGHRELLSITLQGSFPDTEIHAVARERDGETRVFEFALWTGSEALHPDDPHAAGQAALMFAVAVAGI